MDRRMCLAAAWLFFLAAPSTAQDIGLQSWGLRGGVSLNPDQFHFGVFVDAGHLTKDIRFQPGFELGLGNGVRLGAVNLDALYFLKPSSFRPYLGGGLGINFIDVTDGFSEEEGLQIKPAVNIVGGVEWGEGGKGSRRYLLEARLGLGDTPDFKITAGLTF